MIYIAGSLANKVNYLFKLLSASVIINTKYVNIWSVEKYMAKEKYQLITREGKINYYSKGVTWFMVVTM